MNDILWLLRFLMLHSLMLGVPSERISPFIFHPEKPEFYLNWVDKGPYVAACPSVSKKQVDFNQKKSLDQKSLFVRKTKVNERDEISCEKNFDLAVAMHSTENGKFIEFGYEVYFNKNQFKLKINTSNFNQFRRIPQSSEKDDPSSIFHEENTAEIHPMGFIWFSKIVVQYDFEAWNVNSLSYFITEEPEDMTLQCQDDNLGKDFYNRNELINYYENQESVLGDFCSSPDDKCVTKYNLLWPYQFRSASSPFSCSDLASIPVWYENTEELLNFSEKFLVSIAEHMKKIVKVIPGTYEILKLSINEKPQEIFLNPEKNRIPVPRIIFKVVKYQSHDCDALKETCWFGMVIVIHNEPEVKDKICTDICKEWGWESIQYMTTLYAFSDVQSEKSEHIYCCKLEDIEGKLNYVKDGSKTGQLNLTKFPKFDTDTGEVGHVDMQGEIEEMMYYHFE